MKKIALIICIITAFMVMLSGCSGKPVEEKNEPVKPAVEDVLAEKKESEQKPVEKKEEVKQEEPEPVKDLKVPESSPYDELICEMYNLIATADDETEVPEGMMGLSESARTYGENALSEMGYKILDLNGDGSPELMVGSSDDDSLIKNYLCAIYTLKNGVPELVLEAWYRNSYSLDDKGGFVFSGSGGAAFTMFGTFRLSTDGQMVCDEYYFTSPTEADPYEIGFYYNNHGEADRQKSKKLDIDMDEFEKLQAEYISKTVCVDFTAFSELAE